MLSRRHLLLLPPSLGLSAVARVRITGVQLYGISLPVTKDEIEAGLKTHSLITNDEQRQRYRELLAMVKQEYEDIVKNEVQRAISADEEGIAKLCGNYIDNVNAYTQKLKVRNRYTGQYEEPDERLMRSMRAIRTTLREGTPTIPSSPSNSLVTLIFGSIDRAIF